MIRNSYLSVAARTLVCADPSLRYTSMLLGREATNQQQSCRYKPDHSSRWTIGSPEAPLQCAWRDRTNLRAAGPGHATLGLPQAVSWICSFCLSVDLQLLSQCGSAASVSVWVCSFYLSVDLQLLSQCGSAASISVWICSFYLSVDLQLLSQCGSADSVSVWICRFCLSVDLQILSQCGSVSSISCVSTVSVSLWICTFCLSVDLYLLS